MSAKYEQELSWNFPTLSQVLKQNDKMITSTAGTHQRSDLNWSDSATTNSKMSCSSNDWESSTFDSPPLTPEDDLLMSDVMLNNAAHFNDFPICELNDALNSSNNNGLINCDVSLSPHQYEVTNSYLTTGSMATSSPTDNNMRYMTSPQQRKNDDITMAYMKATQHATNEQFSANILTEDQINDNSGDITQFEKVTYAYESDNSIPTKEKLDCMRLSQQMKEVSAVTEGILQRYNKKPNGQKKVVFTSQMQQKTHTVEDILGTNHVIRNIQPSTLVTTKHIPASNKNKRKSSNPVKNSLQFEANNQHNNGTVLTVPYRQIKTSPQSGSLNKIVRPRSTAAHNNQQNISLNGTNNLQVTNIPRVINIKPEVVPSNNQPIIILPSNNQQVVVTNSSNNNGQPQVIKLLSTTNNKPQQQFVKAVSTIEYDSNCNKNKPKPLMASNNSRKKLIIPAIPKVNPTSIFDVSNTNSNFTVDSIDEKRCSKQKERQIKNRLSASKSRERKKQEFIDLKNKVYELNDENENLKRLNKDQQDEINQLVQKNNTLQNEVLKYKGLLNKLRINIQSSNRDDNNPFSIHSVPTSNKRQRIFAFFALCMVCTFTFSCRSLTGVMHPNEIHPITNQHLPAIIDQSVHRNSRRLLSVPPENNTSTDQYFIDDAVKTTVDDLKNMIFSLFRQTKGTPHHHRLLKRKLKEELGLNLRRRIPYAVQSKLNRAPTTVVLPAAKNKQNLISDSQTKDKLKFVSNKEEIVSNKQKFVSNSKQSSNKFDSAVSSMQSPVENKKVKLPPPPPTVNYRLHNNHNGEKPCTEINETETIRTNSLNLDRWVKTYHANENSQKYHEKKSNRKNNYRRKQRNSEENKKNSQVANVNAPALYNEQSKINMFMKNFDRDNDTTYIIYFNHDLLLIQPINRRNLSSKQKLSLLFPSPPPNDTFLINDDDNSAMFKIDCDVSLTSFMRVHNSFLKTSATNDSATTAVMKNSRFFILTILMIFSAII